ncbi:MFGE8 [Acanthosepion pharaonis]|uniref:MFGE8 n=1 Tax=Acanthosepion pharaonis TaxID=158019 RepID=A0A812CCK5_ACAPH|nr:MFGE8 [Sepia pharaonis]
MTCEPGEDRTHLRASNGGIAFITFYISRNVSLHLIMFTCLVLLVPLSFLLFFVIFESYTYCFVVAISLSLSPALSLYLSIYLSLPFYHSTLNTFRLFLSRDDLSPSLTMGLTRGLPLLGLFFGLFLPSTTAVCVVNGPLGMTTGEIKDFQIKSSNSYPQEWDKFCHEKYGRVYMPNKYGWCAKYKSPSEWLMVDLGVAAKVTGVMTQGRGDGVEWVTSFLVSYSMDSFEWHYVHDDYNNQKVFEGNIDAYTVKHSYFDRPILARYIKFHTVSWNRHPSMRVEILGCQLCKEPIGLPPYGKMSASSNLSFRRKSSCQPEDGNILSNKAWCSKKQDKNQWLQIDIGPPTLITAIIVRGRADTRRKHWVTKFNVTYSNDTQVWYGYRDALHLASKNQWQWNSESHSDEGLVSTNLLSIYLSKLILLISIYLSKISIYLYMILFLSLYLILFICVHLSISFCSLNLSIYLFKSIYLSHSVNFYLSIYLSIYLSGSWGSLYLILCSYICVYLSHSVHISIILSNIYLSIYLSITVMSTSL